MAIVPERHHRRSIRLKGYNYSQAGVYFVTVCAHDRVYLFGNVADGMMVLNDAGRIVQRTWDGLPDHYPGVELDAFVVMPNHVHGIMLLGDRVGAGFKPVPTTTQPVPTTTQPAPTTTQRTRIDMDGRGIVHTAWVA